MQVLGRLHPERRLGRTGGAARVMTSRAITSALPFVVFAACTSSSTGPNPTGTSDPAAWRVGRWTDELTKRRDDGLTGHERAKLQECAHHEHAHLDRARAVEDGGGHQGAVLGECERGVLDVRAAVQDHKL